MKIIQERTIELAPEEWVILPDNKNLSKDITILLAGKDITNRCTGIVMYGEVFEQ